MSAGLFLPSLLIGAAWGRIASKVIHYYSPGIVSGFLAIIKLINQIINEL